jgi:two-component system, cell cycle response regulator
VADLDKSKILILDDNAMNLKVLSATIRKKGFKATVARSGNEAFELMKQEKPDLILLDVMMHDLNGYEVCRILKNHKKFKDIPIIFIMPQTKIASYAKCFLVGGVDYVTKPYNIVELNEKIKTHLSSKKSLDEIKSSYEQLKLENKELQETVHKLEKLSITDPLTGLYNRRYITERMEEENEVFLRKNREFSMMLLDIDHFKTLNDTYGHDCGDYVLKLVAQKLLFIVRKSDIVSRWGGEEFLILLPETSKHTAKKLAERIRKNIENMPILYEQCNYHITLTIGISENKSESIHNIIKRADNALYIGKNSGRNCVYMN